MAKYLSWDVAEAQTMAPLLKKDKCGIYILEFKNGERYVGQTVDMPTRFTTHVHGSAHHRPWDDIVKVYFMSAKRDELDLLERQEIRRQRSKGKTLRNKTFNMGHFEPTPFDDVVEVEEQKHWATGQAEYGWALPSSATATKPLEELGKSKLYKNTAAKGEKELYEKVCSDLAYLISQVLPSPAETESVYWTLSDYPGTAGGRFATLNAGSLEIAFFPRFETELSEEKEEYCCYFNFLPPVDEDDELQQYIDEMEILPKVTAPVFAGEFEDGLPFVLGTTHYPIKQVNYLAIPIGKLEQYFANDPEILSFVRMLVIQRCVRISPGCTVAGIAKL